MRDEFVLRDLGATPDAFAKLEPIIRSSTFRPVNSEMLRALDTQGEINNNVEAAIFIHLIHHFVTKVREVTQSSGSSASLFGAGTRKRE